MRGESILVETIQLETALTKLLRARGYVISRPPWSADFVCLIDGHRNGRTLNITELTKDIIREIEQ